MSAKPLNLRPVGVGVIPPDLGIGIVMQRLPPPAPKEAPVVVPVCPPPFSLPAGMDNFADAAEIKYGVFRDAVSAYTYTKDFTIEAGETEASYWGTDPDKSPIFKTAWWKFFVPIDKTIWVTIDTQLSFGEFVQHVMSIYSLIGAAVMTNISGRGSSSGWFPGSELGNVPQSGTGYYGRLDGINMFGTESGDPTGTWFYVQVGDTSVGEEGQAIVLRMSISETATGAAPADGKDPS